jgi:hypothetical protein
MQDRYVGDYLKLGILRALSPGYRLAVAWWLFPDESHNLDGRHVGYLQRPEQWRHLDPMLFDALAEIVASNRRNIRALETANLLPGALFANEVIPTDGLSAQRKRARHQWFARMQDRLADADLVFADPDNGLEPSGYSYGSSTAGKSVLLGELRELAKPERCLIVYHHHTRRKGGHHAEMVHWADRLRAAGFSTVDALRTKPYSPRVYFLLDAPADVRYRAEQIAVQWDGLITWHSHGTIGGTARNHRPQYVHSPPTAPLR